MTDAVTVVSDVVTGNYLSAESSCNYSSAADPTEDEGSDGGARARYVFIITYTTLRFIQGFISVLVNIFTIIVITKYKKLLTTSNLLILSLAIADTLTGLTAALGVLEELTGSYIDDEAPWYSSCVLLTLVALNGYMGNCVNILAIGCDRFVSIRYAIFHRTRVTVTVMRRFVIALWSGIVAVITLVVGLLRRTDTHLNTGRSCAWTSYFTPKGYTYGVDYPFIFCSFSITLMYVCVAYLALKRSRSVQPNSEAEAESKHSKQQRKVTKMMALVVGTYYGLYLPGFTQNKFQYNLLYKYYIAYTCNFIYFMNALVNPFIYAWQSKDFSEAYRRLLRIKPRSTSNTNTTNTGHA